MTIADLEYAHKLALAALFELVTMADGEVIEPEAEQINRIAGELGEEEYRKLLDKAEEKFTGLEELKAALQAIENQEARETIFGVVLEEVMESPATTRSSDLLDWLKNTWNIEVKEA